MFDVSLSELLMVGVVALVAVGPKELPGMLRVAGQVTRKVKRESRQFMDDLRHELDLDAPGQVRGEDGRDYPAYDLSDVLPEPVVPAVEEREKR